MDILVSGAGVLGSLYAARLQDSGHSVSVLARGQRLAGLREHGVVVEDDATGRRTVTRVKVVEQLAPGDAYDLVLVVMRKTQVAGVLPALAANSRTPNVLFMVNNPSGPDEWIAALGRDRVLLGFAGAGGGRDGHVIHCQIVPGWLQPTTFGELNGRSTPRLKQIVRAFKAAGFPVAVCPNMDAWLKTHAAWVTPLAHALYLAGGDNYRLAHRREEIVLGVRAIREGFGVLRALGIPVTPAKLKTLDWMPEPVLVAILQRALNTRMAEVLAARHANAARDEMTQLADEFLALARRTPMPTPAMDRLYTRP